MFGSLFKCKVSKSIAIWYDDFSKLLWNTHVENRNCLHTYLQKRYIYFQIEIEILQNKAVNHIQEVLLCLIWFSVQNRLEITNFAALFHSFDRQGTWRKVTRRKSHLTGCLATRDHVQSIAFFSTLVLFCCYFFSVLKLHSHCCILITNEFLEFWCFYHLLLKNTHEFCLWKRFCNEISSST